MSFETCLAETLKWEGGWSNHKDDPGGPTMRGVIQRVYDAWRKRNGLPRRSVRQIEEHELQAIYRENYWQLVRGDELPSGVDLCVFDYGVNSGPSRSISHLQEVLGVKVDGNMGPVTLDAVNAADPVEIVNKLCARRRKFLRQIKTYHVFGKGWERRVDGVEQVACAMCDLPIKDTPIVPIADADAQSETQGRATDPKEPMSPGTKMAIAGAASGGTGAVVSAPPQVVTDTVGNVGAWQGIGKTVSGMATMAMAYPLLSIGVFSVAAAVIFWPQLQNLFGRSA
jgi:lysozyme family protein